MSEIKVSIIMGHYSEDSDRDAMAMQCARAAQRQRNEQTEFIISANGRYGDVFKPYCDFYIERDVDASPGKTYNVAIKQARGDVFFLMSNDILLYPGAVEESVKLVKKYPKYLSTPIYPARRKWHELPPIDGYNINKRLGSNCLCITRNQFEDIGWFDELLISFDGVNYVNRWTRKGYAVMMTKEIMAEDLGLGKHSYNKQQAALKIKKYRSRRTVLNINKFDKSRLYETI